MENPEPPPHACIVEMVYAALDELHAAQVRIASLEAQLAALKEELRRYVRSAIE